MPDQFDDQTLISLVAAHLKTDPASLYFKPIKTGKHNCSYWVETPRGHFVLRIAPPDDAGFLFYERLMMRQEPELHELIRARTSLPVAEVVAYDFSRAASFIYFMKSRNICPFGSGGGRTRPGQPTINSKASAWRRNCSLKVDSERF